MGPDWLSPLQEIFPNLTEVSFTQEYSAQKKTLGLHDDVNFATVVQPEIIPCGHLFSSETLRQVQQCPSCRAPFTPQDRQPFKPRTTVMTRQAGGAFDCKVVDFSRRQIDSRITVHLNCGTLFNTLTLQDQYASARVPDLYGKKCKCCDRSFTRTDFREVFTTAIADDATTGSRFNGLSDAAVYLTPHPVD